jgi:hypothetical protein
MCGMVKPPRVECGPMHCRLPAQAVSEARQHSAVCQVGCSSGRRRSAAGAGITAQYLVDGNIRPILTARVFSGNATRTRRNPRVKTGGARS